MNIPDDVLYEVEAAIEQWEDKRVIDDQDLEDLLYFCIYAKRVFSQNGWEFQGWVCRQQGEQVVITVKAKEGDTPLVAFITSQTTISGIRQFWRLWEDDRLRWSRDKYPWI